MYLRIVLQFSALWPVVVHRRAESFGILALIYGSGLRVSEVAKLKISDICSKSMRVRVDYAKHNTNRYTILLHTALKVLREYFRAYFSPGSYKPDDWLFKGRNPNEHIHIKSIKNTLIKLRNQLQLDQNISAHTFRHCLLPMPWKTESIPCSSSKCWAIRTSKLR